MPFVYDVMPDYTVTTLLSSSGSANTELTNLAFRQAVRGMDITSLSVAGRGAGLTSITGLAFRARRWTTVGTGGRAALVSPRRIGTTASNGAVDSQTAITQGTVSGAFQVGFGCGAGGPGGWVARDADSAIHVEAGSADEIAINSISGGTSLGFDMSGEMAE